MGSQCVTEVSSKSCLSFTRWHLQVWQPCWTPRNLLRMAVLQEENNAHEKELMLSYHVHTNINVSYGQCLVHREGTS